MFKLAIITLSLLGSVAAHASSKYTCLTSDGKISVTFKSQVGNREFDNSWLKQELPHDIEVEILNAEKNVFAGNPGGASVGRIEEQSTVSASLKAEGVLFRKGAFGKRINDGSYSFDLRQGMDVEGKPATTASGVLYITSEKNKFSNAGFQLDCSIK